MMRPSLNDLTAFVAIATHRSFRRAADELGTAPSTVSHAMRGLEDRLGVRLLNRTTSQRLADRSRARAAQPFARSTHFAG